MMRFGLLGRRLGHSLSPELHKFFGDYSYTLIEKEPEELPGFFADFPLDGINVTVPYKKAVIPFLSRLDESAVAAGAVNTVARRGGELVGFNTDMYGFSYMLRSGGIDPAGEKCLILGTGGAAAAVRRVLEFRGARSVVNISRSGEDNYGNISRHADAGIVVNATPVGMFPGNLETPLDLTALKSCRSAADLIYNPPRTKFLQDAEALGLRAAGGLGMLSAQAKAAAEIFLNTPLPDGKIEEARRAVERDFRNVVLVGMPGCGKTTAAAGLSRLTGRETLDTDKMVERAAGKPVPRVIAEDGEAAFRDMEAAAVEEAGRRHGVIISTGGGAVLRRRNREALRQNGTVIFLKRDLGELELAGRPLSKDLETLRAMRRERLPLYLDAADREVEVAPTPEETLRRITEVLTA